MGKKPYVFVSYQLVELTGGFVRVYVPFPSSRVRLVEPTDELVEVPTEFVRLERCLYRLKEDIVMEWWQGEGRQVRVATPARYWRLRNTLLGPPSWLLIGEGDNRTFRVACRREASDGVRRPVQLLR